MKQSLLVASLFVFFAMTGCVTRTSYIDLYGMPADPSGAEETIIIRPETKHVNVEGGKIVRFVSEQKEFAWHFFVAQSVHAFDLNEVAPPGILDHRVTAYISPDPRYVGGDGGRGQ